MDFRSQTTQEGRPKDGLMAAVREKYRLIVVLAALAVINLPSQHFRHRGLSGREMLAETLLLAAALVLYAFMQAVWSVKLRKKLLGRKAGEQEM